MVDPQLCLEALSALSGCNVESTAGASLLSPQDFVNIVALKEFYKQEGFQQLEYPSLGSLSLVETEDLYSCPPALSEGCATSRTTIKINLQDFFDRQYDYDFTNIKVSSPGRRAAGLEACLFWLNIVRPRKDALEGLCPGESWSWSSFGQTQP